MAVKSAAMDAVGGNDGAPELSVCVFCAVLQAVNIISQIARKIIVADVLLKSRALEVFIIICLLKSMK